MYNLHRVFLYMYVMIDFTKKIHNSDKFRKPAIQFKTTGKYCQYPKGTTEYIKYWEQEMDYCINGYTAEDGDYITGYNYFYLNYCPIQRIVYEKGLDKKGNEVIKRKREQDFPDFWDYDYYYFQAIEEAENAGKHLVVAKSRRKGFSYKGASMLCRNFFLIPNSKSYVYASNKQYLTEDGILTKAWAYMDFIDEYTAWAKKRQVANTQLRRRASMIVTDEYGNKVEVGYKSEIIGVSLKDNPDTVRGKAGKLILWEEAGSFPELDAAWQIARPSVEQDGVAFGLMLAFGCVCAGTKVWTNSGNCINIEDLNKEDGIVGWNSYSAVLQSIENINPPSKKECLEITTNTGRTLRCSKDHPLLWSTSGLTRSKRKKSGKREYYKKWLWHEAEKCKVGEQLGVINEIPFFGDKEMWEPRLIGWLIGDGSYGLDKTPRLSNCDDNITGYVFDNFDTAIERSYITKTGKNYYEIRIKGICKKLRELGIYGQTKNKKRLPLNIHTYSRNTLAELIGGIYDTDGYIRVEDNRAKIILTQCQKEILEQISDILLQFGVHSTIRYIKGKYREHVTNGRLIKSKNGEYRLEINDITSASNFANSIELKVDYKQAALDLIYYVSQNHRAKYRKELIGVHPERIVEIKDIGLQTIYNLTAAGYNNYIANGFVTHNTGGDQGPAVAALREAFYNPESFNCLPFENIWEDSVQAKPCGFFVPQHTNLDIRDENGNRLYMDKDGNTLHNKAKELVLKQREEELKTAKSSEQVDRYIAEHAETPSESFTEFSGNIFPKKELQKQLARIRTNKKLANAKQVGDLTMVDGQPVWNIKKTGDITEYPLPKTADPTGAIVIWEHPIKDAPFGLYIIGVDPYDHDQSGSSSLGSCLVYKRHQNFESYSDMIVAEYTGRPATAEIFYEKVYRLALYYNARIMYENQNKGLFMYFKNKHIDYLLADQPDILKDIVSNSTVNRGKGSHMTKEIKIWAFGKIKEWLEEDRGNGQLGLNTIFSEPLLEELIKCNDKSNVDRIMSLCQIMIYREQLYNVQIKEVKETEKKQRLFNKPLFSRDDNSEPEVFYDHNITTFMFTN